MLKPGYQLSSSSNCALRTHSCGFVAGPTAPWPQPGGPGSPVELTYGFINYTGDMPVRFQRTVVERAFGHWSAVAPLSFTEVLDSRRPFDAPDAAVPDIRIGWFANDHGDGYPFDGAGGVVAHAFYPPPNGVTAAGDMHFDDSETWSDGPGPGVFDIEEVAVHELGHSLGLDHETEQQAVMHPTYTGSFSGLYQDDIDGIRSLYGTGAGEVRPLPWPAPFDADLDWRVGVRELTNYILAFLHGEVWPEQGEVPTLQYVLQVVHLWQARFDGGYADAGGSEPENWVPAQPPPNIESDGIRIPASE